VQKLSLIQYTSLLEVESSIFVYVSIMYNMCYCIEIKMVVMYEKIDECLNCGILVNIKDLNFMILYFKVSNLSFLFGMLFVLFSNLR